MIALLLSLGLGAGLILLGQRALLRWMRLSATTAALTMTLTATGLYGFYSLLAWPDGDVLALHLAVYGLTGLACALSSPTATAQPQHWGPVAISGFFGGLTLLLAAFVVIAERGLPAALLPDTARSANLSSAFPGVVSHDFHKKEALYNQYLQQVQRQQQRGWQVQKGWLEQPIAAEPARFRVAVRTREGATLSGATVSGQFLRSSGPQHDIAFTLHESEPGLYESALRLPLAGQWNLVLRVVKGEDVHEIRATTGVQDRPDPVQSR